MDALSVLRVLTRNPFLLCIFAVVCAWPVVSGLYFMFTHHAWMLMDIDAVLCGARTLGNGHSPYAIHPPSCAGNRPAAYVYAPQIARMLVPIVDQFGVKGGRNLFVWLMLAPATLGLLWFALVRKFEGIDIRYRLLAFASLTSMTFVCANVAIVMHALVLASLLLFKKTRWPFTVMVLLCACVKPTFLTYFVLFLLDEGPLWRRGFSFAWRVVAGVFIFWLMIQTDGHYGHAWQKTLHSVTMARQIGMGWFELTNFVFHVPGPSHLNVELAVGFMAVMTLSGMAIAHWGELPADERLVLGMGLAPLMTPRLLDYDMVLIVPYAALVMMCAHRFDGRIFGVKVMSIILSWVFVIWLGTGIVHSMIGTATFHRTSFSMLLFGLLTGVVALMAVAKGLGWGREKADSPLPS
jgi:hypothetical protein